ncbi:MAG: hypothetical protein E7354_00515 [Clostridiales bacterium]|nr:hypothetical protein [Clostridiales bacterium]
MLSFKPNPDMSVEQAHQVIIDFLNAPNDFSEEIPNETLQSVIDAVFSIKKIREGNFDYNRISSVNFLRNMDKDEVSLGSDECGRAKCDRMYVTEDHLYQNAFRFSLVSLLFHESTHNMQYFKEMDNPCSDFSRKPELATPANVGSFKKAMKDYAVAEGADVKAILHIFETDYFGQQRELEAYSAQYKYMQEIMRDLVPLMKDGDYETRDTLSSYQDINAKYFPVGHDSRGKKDGVLWEKGKRIIDGYVAERLDFLHAAERGEIQYGDVESNKIQALSSILAGLHYSFNEDTALQVLDYIYRMPEDTFENMSNKAMAINSLITSTAMQVDMNMMCTLGGLFERLSKHPENGQMDGRYRNMTFSKEKFFEDYAFYAPSILQTAYGATPNMGKNPS